MEYASKEITLKNGRTCVIRRPETDDAERLVRYQKESAAETPYLVVGPEDITQTPGEQAERIAQWNASSGRLRLLAEVDGALTGVAAVREAGT